MVENNQDVYLELKNVWKSFGNLNVLKGVNLKVSKGQGVVIIGPSGSGKTHLSVAVANERLKRHQDVRYFMVADLLDQLREAFSPDSAYSYYRLFEQVRNADLLILRDFDFDLQHVTPWAREKLNQLLIHRYDSRLPTLLTTVELDENRKTDPIMSRLQDVTMVSIIPIDAPDYRASSRLPG